MDKIFFYAFITKSNSVWLEMEEFHLGHLLERKDQLWVSEKPNPLARAWRVEGERRLQIVENFYTTNNNLCCNHLAE